MREAREQRAGERATFHGTFARLGTKAGWRGAVVSTVLLTDIRTREGIAICDHLWFNLTKGFAQLTRLPGDVVRFDARIQAYEKG
ncbi:MAG: hypothetical protein SH847_01525 [Roseiflexaceae bacterium]|nr:hypothetical protein [Roseiflexaceae bacterium]